MLQRCGELISQKSGPAEAEPQNSVTRFAFTICVQLSCKPASTDTRYKHDVSRGRRRGPALPQLAAPPPRLVPPRRQDRRSTRHHSSRSDGNRRKDHDESQVHSRRRPELSDRPVPVQAPRAASLGWQQHKISSRHIPLREKEVCSLVPPMVRSVHFCAPNFRLQHSFVRVRICRANFTVEKAFIYWRTSQKSREISPSAF